MRKPQGACGRRAVRPPIARRSQRRPQTAQPASWPVRSGVPHARAHGPMSVTAPARVCSARCKIWGFANGAARTAAFQIEIPEIASWLWRTIAKLERVQQALVILLKASLKRTSCSSTLIQKISVRKLTVDKCVVYIWIGFPCVIPNPTHPAATWKGSLDTEIQRTGFYH